MYVEKGGGVLIINSPLKIPKSNYPVFESALQPPATAAKIKVQSLYY